MYVGMKPLKKAVKYKIQAVIAFCISLERFLLYEISFSTSKSKESNRYSSVAKGSNTIQEFKSNTLSFGSLAADSKGFRGCFDRKQREF